MKLWKHLLPLALAAALLASCGGEPQNSSLPESSAAEESVHYTNFAIRCIRIFLALTTLSWINKGAFIFLQAMGKAGLSTALSMLREIVCGVGLPLLLPLFWGLDGIIFFMPLSDIITGVAALYVIISLCRRFKAPAAQSA